MSVLRLFIMMVSNKICCAVNQIILVSVEMNVNRHRVTAGHHEDNMTDTVIMHCNSAKTLGHCLLIAWLLRKWATEESHYGGFELHMY